MATDESAHMFPRAYVCVCVCVCVWDLLGALRLW